MTFLTDKYADISRASVDCLLRTLRIDQGRNIQSDRIALRELGCYLNELVKNGLNAGSEANVKTKTRPYSCRILDGIVGLNLAVQIENDILKGKDHNYQKCTEELKKCGIDSLDTLSEVLMNAINPEFDKSAGAIASLFDEWHKYSDEGAVLVSDTARPIVYADLGKVVERFPSKP